MNIFAIEKSSIIDSNDLLISRTLYQPILGSEAISLYQTLVDLNELDNNINDIHQAKEFENITGLSKIQISSALKKLGAAGLIDHYESDKDDASIIVVNKPMDPKTFSKSVIFDNYSRKVDALFQKVSFKLMNKFEHDKLGFSKITSKYQDVFLTEATFGEELEHTSKITIKNGPKEVEDAISFYQPVVFIEFITGMQPTKMQFDLVDSLKSWGFANSSINMLINYSMETNNSIAVNYIIKIAKDFIKKNVSTPDKVKVELLGALSNRRQRKMNAILVEEAENNNNNNNDDTFDDDMELLGGI